MSGITTLLAAREPRSTNVRGPAVLSFDQLVNLFLDDLVSYWKFQDSTGTDEQGVA